MKILKQESRYTKISIAILCFLSVSILIDFLFDLPIRMSRICWMVLTVISLTLSFIGRKEVKTKISNAVIYINLFVLSMSLIVFKTILSLLRIVF